jgi:hypothetical protein
MVQSTVSASASMSRRCCCPHCAPATSWSWTTSAVTAAKPCATPSVPSAPSCSCPNFARPEPDRKVPRQAQALAAQGRKTNPRCRLQRDRPDPRHAQLSPMPPLLRQCRLRTDLISSRPSKSHSDSSERLGGQRDRGGRFLQPFEIHGPAGPGFLRARRALGSSVIPARGW